MKFKLIRVMALGAAMGAGVNAFAAEAKFLSEVKNNMDAKSKSDRKVASGGRLEAEGAQKAPTGSQTSFYEISPSIGTVSILDKSAFTLGTSVSFRFSEKSPLYLEPSVLVSFLGADNNKNTTIFHADAGLRYDAVIKGSALVPFAKLAVGPSLSTQSGVTVNGNEVSDSYLNVFAGGGLRVLINPKVAARLDTGVTFQATDPGLYLSASVGLPL